MPRAAINDTAAAMSPAMRATFLLLVGQHEQSEKIKLFMSKSEARK